MENLSPARVVTCYEAPGTGLSWASKSGTENTRGFWVHDPQKVRSRTGGLNYGWRSRQRRHWIGWTQSLRCDLLSVAVRFRTLCIHVGRKARVMLMFSAYKTSVMRSRWQKLHVHLSLSIEDMWPTFDGDEEIWYSTTPAITFPRCRF